MKFIKRAIVMAAFTIPLVFAADLATDNAHSVQAADSVQRTTEDFGWQ
ncbi:hypothetical protein ACIRQY_07165 [Streptomyces sp. NPDC101490]